MHIVKRLLSSLHNGFRTVMPTCRQAVRLQSDALDRPLPILKQIGLGFHLLVCRWCRRYGKQLRFLRRAAQEHADTLTETTPQALSAEARERLKRSLRDNAE